MVSHASIASSKHATGRLRDFFTGALPRPATPRQTPTAPTAGVPKPGSSEQCATCANGPACRLVAEILALYGFAFRTNRRGQCYFRGTALWRGECVSCCLGRPELSAPLGDLGDPVWVGYYGTDEAGDMLFDERAPSLADFLKRQFHRAEPGIAAASPLPTGETIPRKTPRRL